MSTYSAQQQLADARTAARVHVVLSNKDLRRQAVRWAMSLPANYAFGALVCGLLIAWLPFDEQQGLSFVAHTFGLALLFGMVGMAGGAVLALVRLPKRIDEFAWRAEAASPEDVAEAAAVCDRDPEIAGIVSNWVAQTGTLRSAEIEALVHAFAAYRRIDAEKGRSAEDTTGGFLLPGNPRPA